MAESENSGINEPGVGQYPGILNIIPDWVLKIKPQIRWVSFPEWWVNMIRNGGSTWSGIYSCIFF